MSMVKNLCSQTGEFVMPASAGIQVPSRCSYKTRLHFGFRRNDRNKDACIGVGPRAVQ